MKVEADPESDRLFRRRYMPLREARVGILTHALHYGTGVFEGIRAHWDDDAEELFVLRCTRALRALEAELRHPAHRRSCTLPKS